MLSNVLQHQPLLCSQLDTLVNVYSNRLACEMQVDELVNRRHSQHIYTPVELAVGNISIRLDGFAVLLDEC